MIELQYDPVLMPAIDESLGSDFWQFGPVGKSLISMVQGPVKFSETVSIFMSRGKCKITLSLRPYEIEGGAIIFVRKGDILQVDEISDDVTASCMLFSPICVERLFHIITDRTPGSPVARCPVQLIPADKIAQFEEFYEQMKRISSDLTNPQRLEAILFFASSFYFQVGYSLVSANADEEINVSSRTVEVFLRLVQLYFRTERFLDFYAAKMKITSKHLSRTIKKQTGLTAGAWIDRFVVLEAKVLLRSSTLNIQEISDYLNFPSQSFFSKYFKKSVGESPTDFRARWGL